MISNALLGANLFELVVVSLLCELVSSIVVVVAAVSFGVVCREGLIENAMNSPVH